MSSHENKPADQDPTRLAAEVEKSAAVGDTKRGDLVRTIEIGESTLDADHPAEPSKLIGKYELRELLGQGGMGAVYLGFDPLIQREVAIKVLPESLSRGGASLKRFLAEARAAGQLNHPNAIAVYDIGEHVGRHFIVMELARGGSVSALLKEAGRLPFGDACRIVVEAARGLQAAHAAGLVHRDVKPENLMLTEGGAVKLVDFGLAKAVDRRDEMAITQAGAVLGTPCYMSPEQIKSQELDARTDVYSLGASFYHILTGKFPFEGDSIAQLMFAHLEAQRPDPTRTDPDLPARCSQVIAKAMAVDPSGRYASMVEFISDVESLAREDAADPHGEAEQATMRLELATPRILVVEPSKLRARVTGDVFRHAGCEELECVTKASEAIAYVDAHAVQVVVASRQLGEMQGEELLRQVRISAASADAMCILVSSDPPEELMAQATIHGAAAYAEKQANPEELLRAVYICTNHALDPVPFAKTDYRELRLAVVSQEGKIPDDLGDWLRGFEVLDVVSRSVEDVVDFTLHDRQLVLWLDQSSIAAGELGARLIGPIAQRMIDKRAALAIVGCSASGMRLHGVKRPAFVATCDCNFDREGLMRLLTAV